MCAVFTYLAALIQGRANKDTVGTEKSTEKVADGRPGVPRASLSMSDSVKLQLQQKQQQAKKDQDCLLM
jgi:hypothetical protein